MESIPPVDPTTPAAGTAVRWQASVTVWASAGGAWTAHAVLADATERRFQSPFELARFFAALPKRPPLDGGLR